MQGMLGITVLFMDIVNQSSVGAISRKQGRRIEIPGLTFQEEGVVGVPSGMLLRLEEGVEVPETVGNATK